jgi:hypothetical protein
MNECNQANATKQIQQRESNQVIVINSMHPNQCIHVNATELMQPSEDKQVKASI